MIFDTSEATNIYDVDLKTGNVGYTIERLTTKTVETFNIISIISNMVVDCCFERGNKLKIY